MAFQSFLTFWTRLCATRTRLRAIGSTVDLDLTHQLHISYQVCLRKLKKKLVKIFLHANVSLKTTDGQVCPSVRVLNGRLNLHVHLVRQSLSIRGKISRHLDFPSTMPQTWSFEAGTQIVPQTPKLRGLLVDKTTLRTMILWHWNLLANTEDNNMCRRHPCAHTRPYQLHSWKGWPKP